MGMQNINRMVWTIGVLLLLAVLLVGCGQQPATAQQNQDTPPTPTPLPPAPALERPTYEVERGPIERTIEPNGRVTPVDLVQLSFRRSGRVEVVHVGRGDTVQEGDVLAQLFQDDELVELAEAEDALIQAQRDLETARSQKEKEIKRARNDLERARRALEEAREEKQEDLEEAQQELEDAQRDLERLLPGGAEDLIYEAEKTLEEARRQAKETADQYSLAKTQAEHALIEAAEAVKQAQDAYSDAYWDYEWVKEHGTEPAEHEEVDPDTGAVHTSHRDLSEEEREEYRRTFERAEEALAEAERNLELRRRDVELAQEEEIYQNQQAEQEVAEAQRELDEVRAGEHEELVQQQRLIEDKQRALEEIQNRDFEDELQAIEDAELALEEAREETFNSELKQVEIAQRNLEKAQKEVENGQIIAPQDGEIIVISIREGDTVEEFDPVVELADPTTLEIAAELGGEQMRQLAEGQPAEVSLLSRPDVAMPAVIRRMPAPYGSGGSGVVQEDDKSTRFKILDTKGQDLDAGSVVKIRIVLERKEDVLLLPPEALRSFEGRTFVVVREGEREQRVSVKTGIETSDEVEIVEGLEEGDIVVGQ